MHKPKRDFFKEYFDPPRPTPEEYERYRKMTPGERLEETFRLTEEFHRELLKEPQEYVDAFFDAVRRDHDEGNRLILERLARCARNQEEPDELKEDLHSPEES